MVSIVVEIFWKHCFIVYFILNGTNIPSLVRKNYKVSFSEDYYEEDIYILYTAEVCIKF